MPFDALTPVDYAVMAAVSAVAAFLVGRWKELALAVALALIADYAVMGLIHMLGGAAPWTALARSGDRFTQQPGDVLILRAAFYAAAIGAIFALKRMYRRR